MNKCIREEDVKAKFCEPSSSMTRSFARKRPIVATVEKDKELRPSNKRMHSYGHEYKPQYKEEPKTTLVLPPLLCGAKKANTLLDMGKRFSYSVAICREDAVLGR